MYYIFNHDILAQGMDIVHAKIKLEPPEFEPDWWDAVPLVTKLPMITFEVNSDWELFDNQFTGTIFDLYSIKLIRILQQAKIRFETFPVLILDETGAKSRLDYEIFHLLEKYPCIDYQLSNIDPETFYVKEIVLNKDFLSLNKLLFRIEELENLVLIHEELKAVLEKNKITGCRYTPIEEYKSDHLMRFLL